MSMIPEQGRIEDSIDAEFSVFVTKNAAVFSPKRPWNIGFHGV